MDELPSAELVNSLGDSESYLRTTSGYRPPLNPSPEQEELSARTADVRNGWTMEERARRRIDSERAEVTDARDGFVWPDPESLEQEGESGLFWEESSAHG